MDKHEITERINIKRIETKLVDETKPLEEIEKKLGELEINIMKKRFWNEIDE